MGRWRLLPIALALGVLMMVVSPQSQVHASTPAPTPAIPGAVSPSAWPAAILRGGNVHVVTEQKDGYTGVEQWYSDGTTTAAVFHLIDAAQDDIFQVAVTGTTHGSTISWLGEASGGHQIDEVTPFRPEDGCSCGQVDAVDGVVTGTVCVLATPIGCIVAIFVGGTVASQCDEACSGVPGTVHGPTPYCAASSAGYHYNWDPSTDRYTELEMIDQITCDGVVTAIQMNQYLQDDAGGSPYGPAQNTCVPGSSNPSFSCDNGWIWVNLVQGHCYTEHNEDIVSYPDPTYEEDIAEEYVNSSAGDFCM